MQECTASTEKPDILWEAFESCRVKGTDLWLKNECVRERQRRRWRAGWRGPGVGDLGGGGSARGDRWHSPRSRSRGGVGGGGAWWWTVRFLWVGTSRDICTAAVSGSTPTQRPPASHQIRSTPSYTYQESHHWLTWILPITPALQETHCLGSVGRVTHDFSVVND